MSKLNDIWNSLKNNAEGLSGRKLSAFWAVAFVSTYLAIKHTDNNNAIEMVGMWLLFGAVCLGLVAIPELLKFLAELKNGKSKENES
ncbi:hypothetical protein UFOVP87_54 [uncultured Caudovirales phage]|uniref:Uncharacterized protein n=1 Tax=uncultured Caudovirales phage TaxID=2100421 RepID=A0A6J5L1Q0_9CAUD|nr:hypothetical protein UFOVP87_54 [uncultured Caudovirales phage]